MKRLFSNDANGVGVLASINLAFAAVARVIDVKVVQDTYNTAMHFLLPLGQLGVAVATIYYILRKARAISVELKGPAKRKKRK